MVLSPRATPFLVCLLPFFTFSCSKQVTAVASAPDIPTVAVAKVTSEDLSRNLVLTAEFKPYQEVDVMAKVAGYIKKINVDVGDRVKQGQLLATLEIPEMGDDLRRADASTRAQPGGSGARARTNCGARNPRTRSRTFLTSGWRPSSAKRPGLVAQQEIDDAQSKDLVAEAQVASAKSALAAAQRAGARQQRRTRPR